MAVETLSFVYTKLVDEIYNDDMQSQRYYLSVIESHRKIPVDYLTERGCIFIPNNDYIKHYIGGLANTYGCELYNQDYCLWTLYYLIPIQDLAGDVVGLVGWDAQNKYKEETEANQGLPMYKVTSKNVFARDKYFLSDIRVLKDCFDTRTIFITDGVFDSVALNYRELPAISLLGSTFSKEVLYFLQWYDRVFVICDNDAAGYNLVRRLKSALPNVYTVVQNKTKDIEEALRSDGEEGVLSTQLKDLLYNHDYKADFVLKN